MNTPSASTAAAQAPLLAERVLRACCILEDVPPELLAKAAQKFQFKTYERDALLGDTAQAVSPLRLVVWGRVSVWCNAASPMFRCGRSSWLGVGSLIAMSPDAGLVTEQVRATVGAIALQRTQVLELAPEDFGEVFWPDEQPNAFLHALVMREKVLGFAPQLVKMLAAQEALSQVSLSNLFALLAGAEVIENPLPNEPLLQVSSTPPDDYYVALTGVLKRSWPGSSFVAQSKGVEGLDCIIHDRPLDYDLYAVGCPRVFKLKRSTFLNRLRSEPDFQRAIVRTNALGMSGPGTKEGARELIFLHADPALSQTRPDFMAALGGLTNLMAERLAVSMCDNVRVLHLVPEAGDKVSASSQHMFTPEPIGFSRDAALGDLDSREVGHDTVPVGEGRDFGAVMAALDMGRDHDVVLVDSSRMRGSDAFDLEKLVLAAMAQRRTHGPDTLFRLAYITDAPESIPSLALTTIPDLMLVTTAVLPSEPPAAGLGSTLLRARQRLARADGLQQKLPVLRQALSGFKVAAGHFTQKAAETWEVQRGLLKDWSTLLVNDLEVLGKGRSRLRLLLGAGLMLTKGASIPVLTLPHPPSWAIGTVRIRVSSDALTALGSGESPRTLREFALGEREHEALCATLDRWGRGITGRRIGLALGGGGSYGFVHMALLRELGKNNIPIDVLSGASAGSTIGAYYVLLGDEGLDTFLQHTKSFLAACAGSVLTSAVFEQWLLLELGFTQLQDTEVTFLPVVTDADTGLEWDIRQGTVARGVRASGSLPPIGPTMIGNHRYLDGGLVANVPVDVLREEGASLVLASNPIAIIGERAHSTWIRDLPLLGPLLAGVDPMLRLADMIRMIPTIFRTTGESQQCRADVQYMPQHGDSGLVSSFKFGYVQKAEETYALNEAVCLFQAQVRRLASHPPKPVILSGDNRILIRGPIDFQRQGLVFAKHSLQTLSDIADFLKNNLSGRHIAVCVSGPDSGLSLRKAQTLVNYLKGCGVPQELGAQAASSSTDSGVFFEVGGAKPAA